jgi:hypothetical protein
LLKPIGCRFTTDPLVIDWLSALRWVFAASQLLLFNSLVRLIFEAAGRKKALL